MARSFTLWLALWTLSEALLAAQEARIAPKPAEQRLIDAEGEIQALWQSYFAVVRDDLPNTKGSVDCSTGRYEEIKPTNSYLVFFVACERIERYLDGYRATIAIGNPHTFGFGRVSGTLRYGENIAAALVKDRQQVPFSFGGELRPGAWTRIQVAIVPADAKDVTKTVVEFEAAGAMERGGGPPARSTSAPQYGLVQRP